ncbi:MAG TPA: DUF1353 domain-containing protein [Spirochaetota bacterium]|nr:DUF1353 domain-containing protein [Spirochaetota bacterium]
MSKKFTIHFRKLTHYKYQLMENYIHATSITLQQECCIDDFVALKKDGQLHIFKGYAWDGPSGPTIDTKDFMRGSLVHDALYQLMRKKQLPVSYKDYADKLLHDICIEDGMSKFRAWYVYQAVRLFGKGAIKPDDDINNT